MTELELKIYEIVRQIPAGKVATYGKIAELAGSRNYARVVGNVMHKNPMPFLELARQVGFNGKLDEAVVLCAKDFAPVPCHRVVSASGKMGANFGMGGPAVQAKMLTAEGVRVQNGKVDLAEYGI